MIHVIMVIYGNSSPLLASSTGHDGKTSARLLQSDATVCYQTSSLLIFHLFCTPPGTQLQKVLNSAYPA